MKAYLIAALLLAPMPSHAAGALFQKQTYIPAAEAALRTPPPADPGPLIETLRWQVLQASNIERARVGLSPLSGDAVLDDAAARYSRKMRDFQFFDHVAPDGETLDSRVPQTEMWRFLGLAENLWSGQGALDWRSEVISAKAAANWVESPGHRENLFNPEYTLAGVGSAMSGDQLYITMLYATPHDDPAEAIMQRDFGDAPSDIGGFTLQLEQNLRQALNSERAQVGLPALRAEPILAQTARSNAQNALSLGQQSGSVLDAALAADPSRAGRLAGALWRATDLKVWQPEAAARDIVTRWMGGQTGIDALDPGFEDIGVGVASNGMAVRVTVIFGEGRGTTYN